VLDMIATLQSQPQLESDQMTTEHEMSEVVTTTTQDLDFVELGEVSVETKGGSGSHQLDGGGGWWF